MKRTGFKRKNLWTLEQTPKQARISRTWPAEHVTESVFQKDVEKTAQTFGWMSSHSHLPFFDTAGWPDLALVHPRKHRFIVRELKVTAVDGTVPAPKGKQAEWIAALALAGVNVDVWTYPMDNDRLIRELSS